MTKFGIGVSILVVVAVLGTGVLLLSQPGATEDNNTETPNQSPVPTPTPSPTTPPTAEFDKTVSLSIGEKVTFADGLNVQLKEINDSRCKPGVQCIWQGELSALLSVGIGSVFPSEVRIGTVNNKIITIGDYKFTLQSATEKSVSIVVSKIKNVSTGNVSGHVTIGPFCPVEREDQPCPVPPEAYSSRKVVVYESNGTTIKQRNDINAQGNYNIALAPGNYFLQIDPAGIGPGEKKPALVKAGQTTVVNFDIDTGIR
jgi:hypothetical protein